MSERRGRCDRRDERNNNTSASISTRTRYSIRQIRRRRIVIRAQIRRIRKPRPAQLSSATSPSHSHHNKTYRKSCGLPSSGYTAPVSGTAARIERPTCTHRSMKPPTLSQTETTYRVARPEHRPLLPRQSARISEPGA